MRLHLRRKGEENSYRRIKTQKEKKEGLKNGLLMCVGRKGTFRLNIPLIIQCFLFSITANAILSQDFLIYSFYYLEESFSKGRNRSTNSKITVKSLLEAALY